MNVISIEFSSLSTSLHQTSKELEMKQNKQLIEPQLKFTDFSYLICDQDCNKVCSMQIDNEYL